MTDSYWIETVPLKRRYAPFSGSKKTDVAIIGGGIAGLSAAYFLSKMGKTTVLLEQNTLGSGDTGYTTAFISHFLDNISSTIKTWSASQEVINIFKLLVAEEKIDCEFKIVDSIAFTKKAENIKRLQEEALALKKLNATVQFLNAETALGMCMFEVGGAMHIKNEAQFHIRKFLLGVAEAAIKKGCEIFEDSNVLEIAEGGRRVLLENGEIKCDKVLITTGMPGLFSEVSKLLTPYFTYVIAADFLDPKPFPGYLFWDDEEPYHYFRWISEKKVILGGEDRPMKGPRPPSNPHENLKNFLEKITKREANITHTWQGSIFASQDSLPYYGAHQTYGNNILFATGFGGNGMTFGMLAGKVLSDIIIGKENEFIDLFAFSRKNNE